MKANKYLIYNLDFIIAMDNSGRAYARDLFEARIFISLNYTFQDYV